MKILVVDDSRTIRAAITSLLERMGHAVIEAENGQQAMERYVADQPELVLMDVAMPVLDGYEAAKRLRHEYPDDWVPIIFLSSMEADQDLDRAIDAGGDDYLVKPVSFVVLNAKIRALHRLETMRRKLVDVSSELSTANRTLERLSRLDALTGLANRRHFDSFLATETRRAARDRVPLSLILADVDHFKSYNDHYGHQAGDTCLKQIAAALRAAGRRPADLAARYGGEEFVIVLPETERDGAVDVAKSIAGAIAELGIPHSPSPLGAVTLSQGIASLVPQPHTPPEELLGHADQALYRAKERGRNQYVVFD